MTTRRRTTTTRIEVSSDRGVFMISVAAELAEMHPQTLRMYEQRGLIEPKRSPKGTRLYSHEDVEKLRRIQQMTAELGLNLAGVEKVLELEEQLERTRRKVAALERRRGELEAGDRGARRPPRSRSKPRSSATRRRRARRSSARATSAPTRSRSTASTRRTPADRAERALSSPIHIRRVGTQPDVQVGLAAFAQPC